MKAVRRLIITPSGKEFEYHKIANQLESQTTFHIAKAQDIYGWNEAVAYRIGSWREIDDYQSIANYAAAHDIEIIAESV